MSARKLTMEELNRLSVDEYKGVRKNPFVLLLDNVRSAHNVGSAFRTADAFRVEKMYLCGITGTPPNREIAKTALGADESVPWEHVPEATEAIRQLRTEGYQILVVEQTSGSVPLQKLQLPANGKYCFVFGNEVFGVKEEIISFADMCLEIPQFGTKHSLNVSVTIGIVLWQTIVLLNQY